MPGSRQVDFHQQWWFFNGVFTTNEASLTVGSFVLIHVYHATFMCLSSPNSQFMSLDTSCKHF